MYTFECPNCGILIKTNSLKNFSCGSCGNNFDEESDSKATMKNYLKELSYQELLKKLPTYYNFEKTIDGGISVKIPIKQMIQPEFVIMFLLTAICCLPSGLAVLVKVFFAPDATTANDAPVIVLAAISFISVGIAATWASLYIALDTVEIKADKGELRRTLTPISVPYLEDIVALSSNISQFYCKHLISRGKNRTTHRYNLYMKLTNIQNGKESEISLIAADNPTTIWAMEIFIERAFGIEDERVYEEHI